MFVAAVTPAALDRLFDKFAKVDTDGSGSIDLEEFYKAFKLERTPFADRVFSMMGMCIVPLGFGCNYSTGTTDEDNSGEIDFREFGAVTAEC